MASSVMSSAAVATRGNAAQASMTLLVGDLFLYFFKDAILGIYDSFSYDIH
ncbi:hypothetical protein RND71_011782 [Anisodus tanguticus]|uniref:Uncharacterized protein n=1 Tax=Anisodus tanguticus TaxID=243964 RepID=A0AAE1VQ51_9SOLA|nr:hypothetical protein RND71_011782 [Anisodus tanguticus]